MRICLITPPSPFLLDERVFMSLGILRVGAVLEQAGHAVEHLDLTGISNYEEALIDHATRTEAAIFGLTATTPQMPAAARVAAALRSVRPDARLILGGPHVTLVNAALKRERRLGIRDGRASRAYEALSGLYDVLVAGDGEHAVHVAILPSAPKLIDADDASGPLFLTNETLNALPWPARHLVDVDSYHYEIAGEPALSLIAQLGCLAAGTLISMADGSQRPIEQVSTGDSVFCFNERENRIETGPVVASWKRDAQDLWQLMANNTTELLATSEHPIWTREGWKTVGDLREDEEIGVLCEMRHTDLEGREDLLSVSEGAHTESVPDVQEEFRSHSCVRPSDELVFSSVQEPLAAEPREHQMAESGASRYEGQVGCDDRRGTDFILQHRGIEGCGGYSESADVAIGNEARRTQSHEAARGCGEGVRYGETEVVRLPVGQDEAPVGRWQDDSAVGARRDGSTSEPPRIGIISFTPDGSPDIPLRRKRGILDRPLHFREAPKPGLRRQQEETSDIAPRGVLAYSGYYGGGRGRLHFDGLVSSDNLGQRTPSPQSRIAPPPSARLRFVKLTRKRFLGRSTVYNITVCPGHSYIANGIIVHNCPFGCGFCGGRESSMLRRIRTRTTENVVAEIEHLYGTYGVRAFMMYDDELNINKEMVGLMKAIAAAQKRLGVEWKLRGFIKSQLFTDEQAEAMWEAGFRWILVGFESGSPRILENINKRATREENSRCMEIARNHSLKVKALMSIGHPGESRETVAQTWDWLIKERPDDFDITIITTYPGTPYYDEAEPMTSNPGVWTYTAKSGDRLHAHDLDFTTEQAYYKGVPGEYQSFVFTDYLTAEELVEARDHVEADVRKNLCIEWNVAHAAARYEHTMGMGLPDYILRASTGETARVQPLGGG